MKRTVLKILICLVSLTCFLVNDIYAAPKAKTATNKTPSTQVTPADYNGLWGYNVKKNGKVTGRISLYIECDSYSGGATGILYMNDDPMLEMDGQFNFQHIDFYYYDPNMGLEGNMQCAIKGGKLYVYDFSDGSTKVMTKSK